VHTDTAVTELVLGGHWNAVLCGARSAWKAQFSRSDSIFFDVQLKY